MSIIQSATPILQFGTSRFLQAHADLFLCEELAWVVGGGAAEAFVREVMVNPAIRARLEALYTNGVLPGFATHGFAEAPGHVATTLGRFANPSLTIAFPKLPKIIQKRSTAGSVPSDMAGQCCTAVARTRLPYLKRPSFSR